MPEQSSRLTRGRNMPHRHCRATRVKVRLSIRKAHQNDPTSEEQWLSFAVSVWWNPVSRSISLATNLHQRESPRKSDYIQDAPVCCVSFVRDVTATAAECVKETGETTWRYPLVCTEKSL